jgi:DMSO/TMAO reductase YedYZ heme-binding membrane subunit
MKQYITTIKYIQNILLGIGIVTLVTLPHLLLFIPTFGPTYSTALYAVAHATVFFVMLIRPLADIMTGTPFIRPLVILRKGFGVLSASIIVSFALAKVMADPGGYVLQYLDPSYWSIASHAVYAHIADVTAFVLLITSNNFSKRVLGAQWKRIQRLSYVYFYASAFYVFATFGTMSVFVYMCIITIATITAFLVNTLTRFSTPRTV